jgi:hypothetical protein
MGRASGYHLRETPGECRQAGPRHEYQLFGMFRTKTLDPIDGIMTDAIKRAQYYIGLRQNGAQALTTVFATAVVMNKTPIMMFNQTTVMTALVGPAANK